MHDNQSGITEQNGEVSYFKYENVRMHDTPLPRGRGALPYMGDIDVCSPKGYVFQLFWP